MRLFIIGHPYTLDPIKRFILKSYRDITFEVCEVNLSNTEGMVRVIQKAEAEYDCILFSGQLPYDAMLNQMVPSIPWDYVQRQQRQLLGVLLEAAVVKGYDIRRLCVDLPSLMSMAPRELDRIYRRIGIGPAQTQITYIEGDPLDQGIVEGLIKKHVSLYQAGAASFCMTGVSPVYERLVAQGVPALRLRFDEGALEEAVTRLRLRHLQHTQDQAAMMKMMMIELYDLGESYGGAYRQRAALHSKLLVIDEILALSNRLDGALLELGGDQFCLVFYEPGLALVYRESLPALLKAAQQRGVGICAGFGVEAVPRLCRQHALRALQCARDTKGSAAFYCDSKGVCHGPIQPAVAFEGMEGPAYYTDDLAWTITKKAGVHTDIVVKLFQMRGNRKDGEFSSHDLAKELGVSVRNANRILLTLENHNIVALAGKKVYPGGGRPLRIFRFCI